MSGEGEGPDDLPPLPVPDSPTNKPPKYEPSSSKSPRGPPKSDPRIDDLEKNMAEVQKTIKANQQRSRTNEKRVADLEAGDPPPRLRSIIRSVLALHNLVNNKLYNKEKQRAAEAADVKEDGKEEGPAKDTKPAK